jgi:hypothetical protein
MLNENYYPQFMGMGIPLLGTIGFIAAILKGKAENSRKTAIILGVSTFFMFLLSLGPILKLGNTITGIPLPFYLIMKIAPGFDKMHTPYRFLHTAYVIWAPLIGLGLLVIFNRIKKAFGSRKLYYSLAVVGMFLLLGIDIICYPNDKSVIRFKDAPRPVTSWLAERKINGGVLEMPFSRKQEQFLTNTR